MLGRSTTSTTPKRAFTLLEMLVALAVLMLFVSMTFPSVGRLMANQDLKTAAESVQSTLFKSRVRAIGDGLTYQFRYEPFGRRFLVIPYELPAASPSGTGTTASADTQTVTVWRVSGQLPEEMIFQPSGGEPESGQPLDEEWLTGLPDLYELSKTAWSPALLLRADGSATDGVFELLDDKTNKRVVFTLRGLTGIASISELQEVEQ